MASQAESDTTAASRATEAFIAKKEALLQQAIQKKYANLQGQERELRELQLQLKVTTGPKKSALEHLRKVIEVQTEKVSTARAAHLKAQQVYKAATEVYEREEAKKEALCKELNDLIQESVAAQVNKLEELICKVQGTEYQAAAASENADAGSAPTNGEAKAQEGADERTAAASADSQNDVSSTPPSDTAAADPIAAQEAQREAAREAEREAAKAAERARREAASAAKSRHVQIGARKPSSSGGQGKGGLAVTRLGSNPSPEAHASVAPAPVAVTQNGNFAGFE